MEKLLEELTPHTYYQFALYGVDLSITKAVILLWISAIIVFLMIWIPSRRLKLIPTGWQNVAESLVEFTRNSLVFEVMGEEGKRYFPWVATLFLYIFVTNLLGLIPGSFAATSLTGTTAAWAIIVFLLYNIAGINENGVFGYIKSFVPRVPLLLLPIMIPIEIVSHIARPFSLAVRLFANILAGHMVLGVFTFLSVGAMWWLKPLPFVMIVIMNLFEVLVAGLQAYIFAILAAIYISSAIHPEH